MLRVAEILFLEAFRRHSVSFTAVERPTTCKVVRGRLN